MSVSTPWFVDAFTSTYLEVYSQRDETTARREVQGALNLMRHDGSRGRLLDLAAGAGRHSKAFRTAGCPVVCFDLSADLTQRSVVAGLPTVRGDMRTLPFRGGAFAAVACLFSSFGYFDTDAEHEQTLREIARVLVPGGRVLLDLMDRETVRFQLRPQSVELIEGMTIEVERALVDGGVRVEKLLSVRRSGTPTRTWRESVRLFTADELQVLANAAGLLVERTLGDYDGRRHVPGETRRLLLLRKPPISEGVDSGGVAASPSSSVPSQSRAPGSPIAPGPSATPGTPGASAARPPKDGF